MKHLAVGVAMVLVTGAKTVIVISDQLPLCALGVRPMSKLAGCVMRRTTSLVVGLFVVHGKRRDAFVALEGLAKHVGYALRRGDGRSAVDVVS